MKKIKLTEKRQLTIPKMMLSLANIDVGEVKIEANDNKIIITQDKLDSSTSLSLFLQKNGIPHSKISVLYQLKGGMMSDSFLCLIDDKKWVYKKYRNLTKTYNSSIEWKTKYFSKATKTKVVANENTSISQFHEGITKSYYLLSESEMNNLVRSVKLFWNTSFDYKKEESLKEKYKIALKTPFKSDLWNVKGLGAWKQKMDQVIKEDDEVFVHGDLYSQNVIWNEGKAKLIDFDFIGIGYKKIDIAWAILFDRNLHNNKKYLKFWKNFFPHDTKKTVMKYIEATAAWWIYHSNTYRKEGEVDAILSLFPIQKIVEELWKD